MRAIFIHTVMLLHSAAWWDDYGDELKTTLKEMATA
jgi:hypothetical protein